MTSTCCDSRIFFNVGNCRKNTLICDYVYVLRRLPTVIVILTLDVVAASRFDSAFTFIYSPRPGTPAAELTGDFVDPEVVQDRYRRLVELQTALSLEANASAGWGPGRNGLTTSHCFVGSALSQGTIPARTSDDLPLPEEPTTATKRLLASRFNSSIACSSRPKNR